MKQILILLFLFQLILMGCSNSNIVKEETEKEIQQRNTNNTLSTINESCYKVTKLTVKGHSMFPLIENGEELILLKNYYNCNEIKRNDIVAYEYAGNNNPLIKKVFALKGDNIKFINNSLIINDKILKNSQNNTYKFKSQEINMINLYIKNGKLNDGFLIFGDNIESSTDSKKFGAISKNNIIGKFDI